MQKHEAFQAYIWASHTCTKRAMSRLLTKQHVNKLKAALNRLAQVHPAL